MLPTPDELILALLKADPKHGYHLLDAFRDHEQLGYIWDMSAAQIYAVLKRLERNGEIVGTMIDSPNAPARTQFHVTAAGDVRLDAWLNEAAPSPSIRRVRLDFLSRIYAARTLDVPIAAIVKRQQASCLSERTRLTAALVTAESESARMALSLQIAQFEAVLTWIAQTFRDVETGARQ